MAGFGGLEARPEHGMTLRDFFAAQFVAGLAPHYMRTEEWDPEDAAAVAYQIANAMLKEREKFE